MRIKIFALALIMFSSIIAWSQDDMLDSLDLSFESSPIKEEKIPYFAIAGGFTGTFFFANFDEMNQRIVDGFKEMRSERLNGSIFMPGAEGFTAIGIIPNMRLGFFGAGGSKTIKAVNADTTRSIDYTVSFNGISFDYAYVPTRRLAILAGVNLGWGTMAIEYYRTTKEINWTNFGEDVDSNNFMSRAEARYWLIQPHLNVEFAVTPFIALRGSAGYSYSLMGDWKFNQNAALENVPKNVNASGLYAQFGLFLGLFNY
ncbi:MAG: hypothetical protein A2X61_15780 [Ignavibacteria bacterium GWB2_35_12]|nr:MAG: hypothetical protein A2X63_10745 [Ignavibacteria bacterium GWA2_35_8]OGU40834.1 MAG: hypothetical protein A2X61_15780 [Ignavibacteria bacterium GWB2_35_12]OGU87126.1 MAG: hypothetical protein A2220_08155 [Ignavibacteria bacterium RIFOXYA2_FULL_35_10]OGV24661.1 MAG: hypothetical protein A2475_14555 [Ignavibacteria bacterium RIFOXYC2_FULL_35_21]